MMYALTAAAAAAATLQTLFDAWHEKYCGGWEHVET
jgi:hypothetical protein